MTCEQLKDEYELHALGLSEDMERDALENHLRNGCVNCSTGIRQALLTNVLIMQPAPGPESPSKNLRKRVLYSIGTKPVEWGWRTVWATGLAGLLAAVVWLGMRTGENTVDMADARQTLAILNGPETRQVVFGNTAPAPPQGRVLVNARHGVLLLANNLPEAPAGKTYELWVIPKGGSPKPSGLFKSDSSGAAMYLSKSPLDVSRTAAVAVTLEPESGSAAPTSTPVIVAAL